MMSSSPFSQNRFEYESMHLYFLQERLFRRLEAQKPVFLVGSRGTGKTTLLKSLCWRERIANPHLQTQLAGKPFGDRCIGIYLKLPEIQLAAISDWLSKAPTHLRYSLFSTYLEFVFLQEILAAVVALSSEKILRFSATDETACVRRIADIIPGVIANAEPALGRPDSLLGLSFSIRDARRRIENSSLCGVAPEQVAASLALHGQLATVSKAMMHELSNLFGERRASKNWIFKVCFDEGEALDELGRLIVNTWMRLAQDPLYFVVAYVSKPNDISGTLVPNLTLQQADRDLLNLDEMTDKEFTDLAEGVATVRANVAMGKAEHGLHSTGTDRLVLESFLGKLNINQLLEFSLKESVSEKAKDLLNRAGELKASYVSTGLRSQTTSRSRRLGDDEYLPIYEAYLIQKLTLPEVARDKPRWAKRAAESQNLRKKMVASYLSICSELKIDLRYSSADMVLQMSDRCIRDFLMSMDSIYHEFNAPISTFVRKRIPWGVQNQALKRASREKYQSIPRSGVNLPTATGNLVEGLALLTASMQSSSKNGIDHLRVPERGIFALLPSDVSVERKNRILSLIMDAAEAGFLRLVSWKDGDWRFRVHTSLAAAYGFSYRGAYYDFRINVSAIEKLISVDDPAKMSRLVEEIVSVDFSVNNRELFPKV